MNINSSYFISVAPHININRPRLLDKRRSTMNEVLDVEVETAVNDCKKILTNIPVFKKRKRRWLDHPNLVAQIVVKFRTVKAKIKIEDFARKIGVDSQHLVRFNAEKSAQGWEWPELVRALTKVINQTLVEKESKTEIPPQVETKIENNIVSKWEIDDQGNIILTHVKKLIRNSEEYKQFLAELDLIACHHTS